MDDLTELLRLSIQSRNWHILTELLGYATLLLVGLSQFVFSLRLEHSALGARRIFRGVRPLRLTGTPWLHPLAGGVAMGFLGLGGTLVPHRFERELLIGGISLVLLGLYLGRQRKFIVRGELSKLAAEREVYGRAPDASADVIKQPLSPLGRYQSVAEPNAVRQEGDAFGLRPYKIVLVLNALAVVASGLWTKFGGVEDEAFHRQITIVLSLCLICVLGILGFLSSGMSKK